MEADHTRLFQACKRERNPTGKGKAIAVSMHHNNGMTVSDMVRIHARQAVSEWIRRYEEDGLAGPDGRPRPGRPPKVQLKKIQRILKGKGCTVPTAPKKLRKDTQNKLDAT